MVQNFLSQSVLSIGCQTFKADIELANSVRIQRSCCIQKYRIDLLNDIWFIGMAEMKDRIADHYKG